MAKVEISNEHLSKMDRVLAIGKIKGDGAQRRERGNRTLLLARILDSALTGKVEDIARKYADKAE